MVETAQGRQLRYFVDANLTSKIMLCFNVLRIPTGRLQKDKPDEWVLGRLDAQADFHPVWITGDHEARTEHPQAIIDSGVSVAWLRANHARTPKQVVFALWFVLATQQELAASDQPLYFEVEAHDDYENETFVLIRHTLQ